MSEETKNISKILLPDETEPYVIKDANAWPLFSENANPLNKLVTMQEVPGVEIEDNIDESKTVVINGSTGGGGAANFLPPPPTTDGEYGLKVTVLNGKATYSWVDNFLCLDEDGDL